MARLSRRFWTRLTVSLIVASAVVVPAAVLGTQALERHRQLDRLGHADPTIRERALNELIRRAPREIRYRDGALARFPRLPADAVMPVVRAFEAAGLSINPALGDALDAELDRLTHDDFVAASRFLADSPKNSVERSIDEAIARLTVQSTTPAQKQELVALLDGHFMWRSPPVPLPIYVEWIARGLDAAEPTLRADAARQLGDLPIDQPAVPAALVAEPLRKLLSDTQPTVRLAALNATAGYVSRQPEFLDEIARLQRDTDPAVAGWATRLIDVAHGRNARPQAVDQTPRGTDRLAPWRGVLAAADTEATRRRWRQLLREMPAETSWQPVRCAVLFRLGAAPPGPYQSPADWENLLAGLEGGQPGSAALRFSTDMPHLVRPAAVRAVHDVDPAWLAATFRLNDRPAARDRACLVAVQRFDDDTLRTLIRELLADHDPDARVSGAVLAGMTGLESSRLDEALKHEADPAAIRLMLIAQRMQQPDRPALAPSVPRLLGREGLPDSTLMLMFLHDGQRRVVLDYLLQSPDAAELLRARRWADVLHAYLPGDAPRLNVWADDEWLAQQLEDLRAWHALRRHTPDSPAGVTGR